MRRAIYTVTLNPSIDVTIWTDGLDDDAVNHIEDERREAGGKGINVSRVLHAFGVDNLCVALAGSDNREEFMRFLQQDALRFELLEVEGAVRENLTLRYGDHTVKLNRRGEPLSLIRLGVLMTFLQMRVHPGDIVTFSGSLPENMQIQDYLELILAVKNIGALIALDCDCLSLAEYQRIAPWLIKPNIHELQHIVGHGFSSQADIVAAAKALQNTGVENVLCTLGGEGMLLISGGTVLRARVPSVQVKSTVGAGDSALAGFIIGTVKSYAPADCVRLAAACGIACAIQEGTAVATRETAAVWERQITVETPEDAAKPIV